MSSLAKPAPSLAAATHAIRAQFFVCGIVFATWGVHVPSVKAHYGLGDRALAMAMLAGGVGSVLTLTQAGRLVGRHGPRTVTIASGLAASLAIALLLAFDSYAALLAVMLAYGIAISLFDVSINAEASEIERLTGRPVMSGFHGMFSLGGMVGSAAASVLHTAGVTPTQRLVVGALASAATIVAGWSAMLRVDGPPAEGPAMSLPRGALLLMGVLAALGLISEGAMYDWSVLYMRDVLAADAGIAALAYASFSAAMAAARFCGDWVRLHVSAMRLMQLSGTLGAVGMALTLLAPHPLVALAGFALVGLGFANVIPILFSAASRVPGVSAAHGIAAVSSLGYLGMMAGPPIIGLISESRSLAAGLSTVVLFSAVLGLAARRALPRG
ncbi:MFS transporter [Piscinibacter terrae]|uniref:MFS transporter n=1 Tax=Piscinibacter terrae TaxID=2496871 RepID=A0A3N7HJS9_9BURK|nr:MFS transporter [Albitalea terrae]RQP21216.1 MFS transporter [Albitalea terrae]